MDLQLKNRLALVSGSTAGISFAIAQALVRQHPGIAILVNNLGIFEAKPFEEIPDADWQRLRVDGGTTKSAF